MINPLDYTSEEESRVRSRKVRDHVIARDKFCKRCGSFFELESHHIRPFSEGGEDSPDNCETLCSYCHKEWHKLDLNPDMFDRFTHRSIRSDFLQHVCMGPGMEKSVSLDRLHVAWTMYKQFLRSGTPERAQIHGIVISTAVTFSWTGDVVFTIPVCLELSFVAPLPFLTGKNKDPAFTFDLVDVDCLWLSENSSIIQFFREEDDIPT